MSETRPKRKVEFIESYWTGGVLGSDYQWNDNHGELIRCKDCKWWHESEMHKGYGDCGQANGITLKSSNWFCADGERKEGACE